MSPFSLQSEKYKSRLELSPSPSGTCSFLSPRPPAAAPVLSLISGVFLILGAESPSGSRVNVSELFVCVCVRAGGGEGRGLLHAMHSGKCCSPSRPHRPAILQGDFVHPARPFLIVSFHALACFTYQPPLSVRCRAPPVTAEAFKRAAPRGMTFRL